MKKVLLTAAFVLAAMTGWCTHYQNYDFSAVAPTGQTLYYKYLNNYYDRTVSVVFPDSSYYTQYGMAYVDFGWENYVKPTGALTIPSYVRNNNGDFFDVVAIYKYAFADCDSLTSVTLPNSILTIGDAAFAGCENLETCPIPNSVTQIGGSAFFGCGLSSVVIPASVTSMGYAAFSYCPNLTSIVVESGNPVLDSRDNCNAIIVTSNNNLFLGCKTTTIPNSVATIGNYAFYGCEELTSIVIPNNVTIIGSQAFRYCNRLASVSLGNGLSLIYAGAFANCTSLTAITIPESVTQMGNWVFYSCDSLASVVFNADSCWYAGTYYSNNNPHTFYGCTGITSFVFGENVKVIPPNLCRGLSGLSSVTIPNSVVSVGDSSFLGCTGITSLSIGNNVSRIGDLAFYNCNHMTSASIGNKVTHVGLKAFASCTSLTSVAIPNSVTYLDDSVFHNCVALSSAVLGNGLTTVPRATFNGCNHMTNLTLGSGIQNINVTAFKGCNAVLRMSVRAEVPPTATSNPFSDFNTGIVVTVPCNSVSAYQTAPYWGFFTNISGETNSFSATSADPTRGSVQVITAPDCNNLQAEVQANAYNGYHFVRWSDGNTEAHRYIVVVQDTAIQAYFQSDNDGVDEVDVDDISVYAGDGRIVVEGAEGMEVRVFDVMGRQLLGFESGYSNIEIPNSQFPSGGVYLVKVGTLPARKVVVVK